MSTAPDRLAAFAFSPLALAIVNSFGVVVEANAEFDAITGDQRTQPRPLITDLFPGAHWPDQEAILGWTAPRPAARTGVAVSCRLTPLPGAGSVTTSYLLTCLDPTGGEHEAAAFAAMVEPVVSDTQRFVDRSEFGAALAEAMSHPTAEEAAIGLSVMAVEIDRYEFLRQRWGDERAGDISAAIAHRLADSLTAGDTMTRLGPAQFAVLFRSARAGEGLGALADALRSIVLAPLRYGRDFVSVTASVAFGRINCGAGEAPDDAWECLMDRSRQAFSEARRHGGNRAVSMNAIEDPGQDRRRILMEDLRSATPRFTTSLAYQPAIDMTTGDIAFVEALLRCEHPDLGTIPAGELLPLVEASGQMPSVSEWVVTTAVADLARWRQIAPELRVSINLAAGEMTGASTVTMILGALNRVGLSSDAVVIEVNEASVSQENDTARTTLQGLVDAGISLALDDFGNGYSSLGSLRRYPYAMLKLDGGLLRDLDHDETLVRSMITLSESLDMVSVAEQVESAEQMRRLSEMGCRCAQGYHIATPLAAGDMEQMLRTWPN